MFPTYGSNKKGHIPQPVQDFLNNNHKNLIGVIGAGNINFGKDYCAGAHQTSHKYKVPILTRFELMGTNTTPQHIDRGITKTWKQLTQLKTQQNTKPHTNTENTKTCGHKTPTHKHPNTAN